MTLSDKQALHREKVRNWSVENLRSDKEFMDDCRADAELAAWVVSQRPEIKSNKPPKIKFLGLKPVTEDKDVKSPQNEAVKPEPVAEIPKVRAENDILVEKFKAEYDLK